MRLRSFRYCANLPELQWGRARASAEMGTCAKNANHASLLQWGRARASAEMREPSGERQKSQCFNGAALVRARKWEPLFLFNADDKLQWGRARASAEMGCDIVLEMSGWYVASMGPRSCERGNNADDHKEERRPPYCFNGAALVRARKSRASASARRGRRCFNGAALVRARKWPGCKQLGLRRRNNRFRAAAIFNLLTNWACRFLFILLCVLRPCLQRCERLAVVRCHVAARTLAHG